MYDIRLKRDGRLLIILAVLVIALFTTWYFMPNSSVIALNSNDFYLREAALPDVSSMQIQQPDGTLNFALEDGKWVSLESPDFPLRQSLISSMSNSAANMLVSRKMENVAGKLHSFGLDEPQYRIKVANDAGDSITYLVGDLNESISRYYVMVEGEDSVYLVRTRTLNNYFAALMNMADKPDLAELNIKLLDAATITTGGSTYIVRRYDPDTNELYCEDMSWKLKGVYDIVVGANSTRVSNLVSYIKTLALNDYVAYEPTEKELESYGLVEPNLIISLDYTITHAMAADEEKNITLRISNRQEDGTAYVMFDGDVMVYRLGEKEVRKLANFENGECLAYQYLCDIPIDTVDALEIKTSSKTYDISIDSDADMYLVNGKPADPELFDDFYHDLYRLRFDALALERTGDEAEMITVRFLRNTDTGEFNDMTMTLVPYNTSYYRAEFAGIDNFLISRKEISALLNDLLEMS